ncbi:MAG: autotransporter domain-containing protein [Micavibrio sp.]
MNTSYLTFASAFTLFIFVLGGDAQAREVVVLPGVVGPVGEVEGVDTQGPGLLTIGAQDINTSNDAGGGITTDAADTASILFTNTSTVTGFTGTVGSTFLDISAGANGNTVTFLGDVFSTTFTVSGTGTVNFLGDFTSNTGSTVDFGGDGFIDLAAGRTLTGAITNTAGAGTGTLTLGANSIVDGAVGAASGLGEIILDGGDALITGQVNAQQYTLGTNILNVGGAFEIPAAGVINTTLFSDLDYGQIVPVGAATIGNNLQVNVNVTGPISNNTTFNIVDAVAGTNGSIVTATDNSMRYLFTANPTANGLVAITTTQIALADIAAPLGNPVVPVIAPVVDALPVNAVTTPLLAAITVLPTAAAISDALAQLVPSAANLGAPQASYRVTQNFQDVWSTHLGRTQEICGLDGQPEKRKVIVPEDDLACKTGDLRSNWWAAAFGAIGEQENDQGYEGYDARSGGVMLAYDAALSRTTRAGVGVRYARTALDANTFDSDSNVDSYQATAYLGYAPGAWYTNGAVVFGIDNYEGSRHVEFSGVDETAESEYDGNQYTVYGTTGYHFYVGDAKTVITPYASLQYTHLTTDGYSETGGNAINLEVESQRYDFIQSGLGFKVARDVVLSDTKTLRPEIHADWLHSFGDDTMENTASFTAGGPSFTTRGIEQDRDTFEVGAGITLAHGEKWSTEAVYDHQWSGDSYVSDQAMVKFVLRF